MEEKQINNLEDMKKLELGDVVKIEGRGKAIYYAESLISRTFLGRTEDNDAIYELEIARGIISPAAGAFRGEGSIILGTILSERIYYKRHDIPYLYDDKNDLLKGVEL